MSDGGHAGGGEGQVEDTGSGKPESGGTLSIISPFFLQECLCHIAEGHRCRMTSNG